MKFKYTYAVLFFLYISQSIPGNFFGAAFPVMLRRSGASLQSIGLLSLLLIPMTFRFLWAPLVDRSKSYKTWILPMQLICFVLMFWLGHIDWVAQFGLLFFIATLYTLASGTQDIGVDGLAVRALAPQERPIGNAFSIAGVYLGTVIGAGAMLMLYDTITFEGNIVILLVVVALPILLLRFYREPPPPLESKHVSLRNLWAVCARKDMRMWYVLLLCLNAPSIMAGGMLRPMMVDKGFSMESLGLVLGIICPIAGIAGCVIAPSIINRAGRHTALIIASVTQLLQILAYLAIDFFALPATGIFAVLIAVGFLQGYAGIIIYTIAIDKSEPSSAATDFTVQATVFGLGAALAGFASGVIAQWLGYTQLYLISLVLQFLLLGFVVKNVRARHIASRPLVIEALPEPSIP
jgi:PAT family beta-lactamase induction signal transducer AmpG